MKWKFWEKDDVPKEVVVSDATLQLELRRLWDAAEDSNKNVHTNRYKFWSYARAVCPQLHSEYEWRLVDGGDFIKFRRRDK